MRAVLCCVALAVLFVMWPARASGHCANNQDCPGPYRICLNSTCHCQEGAKVSQSGQCESLLGKGCYSSEDCKDIGNSVCKVGHCECRANHYPVVDSWDCHFRQCRNDTDCEASRTCGAKGMCVCRAGMVEDTSSDECVRLLVYTNFLLMPFFMVVVMTTLLFTVFTGNRMIQLIRTMRPVQDSPSARHYPAVCPPHQSQPKRYCEQPPNYEVAVTSASLPVYLGKGSAQPMPLP